MEVFTRTPLRPTFLWRDHVPVAFAGRATRLRVSLDVNNFYRPRFERFLAELK